LYCNRSAARRLARDVTGAIEDASEALDISPTYRKAAFRFAVGLLEASRVSQALSAFTHLKRLDPDFPNLPAWLQRCHVRLERSGSERRPEAEPTHYEVLDVPCDCSQERIKQAYRRQSKRLHPDRATASASTRAEETAEPPAIVASTEAFQALQRAYEVLRDPQRRQEYDYGASADWELSCRARYWPPTRFKPFVIRPKPPPGSDMWDPTD